MIRIAFIFIIGIALILVAIYDWRIALRVTIPITLIIASLIGLDMYQTNHERQQREAQRATQERQEGMEKTTIHNSTTDLQKSKEDTEIELQHIEQAERESRLAEKHKTAIQSFFADNRSLIEVYFHSASMCHSGLIFKGKMEDNEHCQTAIEAKDKLQQITKSLASITKEQLKREDSTTMWKLEYAGNQMEYAYHLSKNRK